LSTKTLYPNTLTQTSETGTHYREFNNLSNVKNTQNTYAKSKSPGVAAKDSPHNTPSAITAKNFKAKIPAGSKINSITVEYAADYEGNISIGKPTIDIRNVSGENKKGKALTQTVTKSSATWKGDKNIANINSADFGVKITFPANTKNKTGYVRIKYLRIIIDYSIPDFNISAIKQAGQYTDEEIQIVANCSNLNQTNNSSDVTIQLPSGVTYKESSGDGTITQSGNLLTWKTGLSGKKLNARILLMFTISAAGSYQIKFSESASNHTKNLTVSVTTRPSGQDTGGADEDSYTDDGKTTPDVARVVVDEPFEYTFDLTDIWEDALYQLYNKGITQGLWEGTYEEVYEEYIEPYGHLWLYNGVNPVGKLSENELLKVKTGTNAWRADYKTYSFSEFERSLTVTLKGVDIGVDKIVIAFQSRNDEYVNVMVDVTEWNVLIIPDESDLTIPNFTTLKLTSEETDRLGDEVYTVQSWLKLVTSETYVRDWYKNFRIGVFNNRIEANCTDYTNYDTSEETQSRNIVFPPDELGDDTSLWLLTDKAMNVIIDGETYECPDDGGAFTDYVTESIIPATFEKVTEDVVNLRVIPITDNVLLPEIHYIIRFSQDETLEPYITTVDTTDYTTLTEETIFNNALYWGNTVSAVNTFESVTCDFSFNESYPVYILLTGDYPESEAQDDNDVKFTEPCIIEADTYAGWEKNGNFLNPIKKVLIADDTPAEITVTQFEESNHIVLYKLPLPEDYGTTDDLAIVGIEVTGNIEYSDDLIAYAKLKLFDDHEYLVGNRSIQIDSNDEVLSIGGMFDRWGFKISELTNLDQLELEFGVRNLLESDNAILKLNNVQVVLYINSIEDNPIDVWVNDENVAWYGMYVKDVNIPVGINTETKYLDIEGSDTNTAYRQNIEPKKIKIEFELDGCDLTDTTEQLNELAKLFTNEREGVNPIPKEIRFSNVPNRFFNYILENGFDNEIQISDYKGSLEITVPDGTAWDDEDTVTNVNGYVDTIAAVNPVIDLIQVTGDITIVEKASNQTFVINYDEYTITDTISVDCINREVTVTKADDPEEPIVINDCVDFNSDWFLLQGEFEFTCENAIISKITYNRRT